MAEIFTTNISRLKFGKRKSEKNPIALLLLNSDIKVGGTENKTLAIRHERKYFQKSKLRIS